MVRVKHYDFLRFLGVLIIIYSHTGLLDFIFQLRNFGTPLLIFASGLTVSYIYSNRKLVFKYFIFRRMERLFYPAWIFLTFFFIVYWLVSFAFSLDFPFDFRKVLLSYIFLGGITFMWIVYVYFALALLTPIALWSALKIRTPVWYLVAFLILIFLQEYIYINTRFESRDVSLVFDKLVMVWVPYGLVYILGMIVPSWSRSQILMVFSFLALGFFVMGFSNGFEYTQDYKYPPRAYYLLYAVSAVLVVYLVTKKMSRLYNTHFVTWCSSNSYWVYLWHIGFYFALESQFPEKSFLPSLLFFALMFGLSCCAVYGQRKAVGYLMIRFGRARRILKWLI